MKSSDIKENSDVKRVIFFPSPVSDSFPKTPSSFSIRESSNYRARCKLNKRSMFDEAQPRLAPTTRVETVALACTRHNVLIVATLKLKQAGETERA